ncbi:MAG: hypothetical protein ACLUKN_17500 [Bacilli bacterium]
MGKTAALYVFRRHVGGLTSAGLTETDLGKKEAIGEWQSSSLRKSASGGTSARVKRKKPF